MAVVEGTLTTNRSKEPGLDIYDWHALERDNGSEDIYVIGPVDKTGDGSTGRRRSRAEVLGTFKGIAKTDERGRPTKIFYTPFNNPAKKRRVREDIPSEKLPEKSADYKEDRNTLPDIDDPPSV